MIILVSYLMIVLDISIVLTALPQMHIDLDLSTTGLSWVQNAHTLAFGGLLLLDAAGGVLCTVAGMAWLPADFVPPTFVELRTGHHLRPIRASDVDLDFPAVMGSQERLWSIFGDAWGWPPASMTYEQDRADLARHEADIRAHQSFNYALFDAEETVLLGCVYIDPPEKPGADAEISWWVVDGLVGTELENTLVAFVPHWIAQSWPFERPRYVGHDLTWKDWLNLPNLD